MKAFQIAICVLLSSVFTNAQMVSTETKPYIEVTGSAEADIDPNIIMVSVRIKEFEENRVKVSLDKIEREFLDAVSKSGIEKKNILLSDLTANAVWQKRRDREIYAEKTYQIKFSKNDDVLKFLENAKDVKLDNLEIIELGHTEMAKFRLEIKVEALKAAEKKADALLNAAGAKRGKVLLIQENANDGGLYYMANSYANRMAGDISPSFQTADVQMKKINLQYEILVRYTIEQ